MQSKGNPQLPGHFLSNHLQLIGDYLHVRALLLILHLKHKIKAKYVNKS